MVLCVGGDSDQPIQITSYQYCIFPEIVWKNVSWKIYEKNVHELFAAILLTNKPTKKPQDSNNDQSSFSE